ncbi:MAG: shikimate kinase AroK [Xanthomonadales bacterium]|nr:shikimate kinase AroK [Xanthomonadales bacterium]
MKFSQSIILIGSMGAGKTTVGKKLAQKLHRDFIDCDAELERQTGVDIATIFDIEGEEGFRKRESAQLEKLLQRREIVLATGGGVVLIEENRQRMTRNGIIIYLKTTVEQQLQRLQMDKKRPLLSVPDRQQVLTDLFTQRDPIYQALADITVHTDRRHSAEMASTVLRAINQYLDESGL